jgi:hypothetical protein
MTRRAVLLAAALAALAGCATLRASQARADALRAQLDAYRFSLLMDEVWLEARRLLADRNLPLAGEDARAVGQPELGFGDRLLSPARETHGYGEDVGLLQKLGVFDRKGGSGPSGRSLDTGWRRVRDRYHLDALEQDGGVRVVFLRITENSTDHREQPPVRDLELELALVQRLDPEAAARIEGSLVTGTGPR